MRRFCPLSRGIFVSCLAAALLALAPAMARDAENPPQTRDPAKSATPSRCRANRRWRLISNACPMPIRPRPRAGRCIWANIGAFDNLNPYGVNAGTTAAGIAGPVYESLMARSYDEPFTLYGLVAQSIETDEARDYVVFRLNPSAHFSDGAPISAARRGVFLQPAEEQGPAAATRRLWPREIGRGAGRTHDPLRPCRRRRSRIAADPGADAGAAGPCHDRKALRRGGACGPARFRSLQGLRGQARRKARAAPRPGLLGQGPRRQLRAL